MAGEHTTLARRHTANGYTTWAHHIRKHPTPDRSPIRVLYTETYVLLSSVSANCNSCWYDKDKNSKKRVFPQCGFVRVRGHSFYNNPDKNSPDTGISISNFPFSYIVQSS